MLRTTQASSLFSYCNELLELCKKETRSCQHRRFWGFSWSIPGLQRRQEWWKDTHHSSMVPMPQAPSYPVISVLHRLHCSIRGSAAWSVGALPAEAVGLHGRKGLLRQTTRKVWLSDLPPVSPSVTCLLFLCLSHLWNSPAMWCSCWRRHTPTEQGGHWLLSDSDGKACTPVSFGSFLIPVQTEIRGFYLTKYKDGQEKEKEKQRDFTVLWSIWNCFLPMAEPFKRIKLTLNIVLDLSDFSLLLWAHLRKRVKKYL